MLIAGIILLVYGSLVVSALTLRFPNNLQFTTEHFQYVLSGTNGDALRNTLVFSSVAAAISAVFALFAGWLVQRGHWKGRQALDLLLILPAAIPGIFFGLGYLLAFNQWWLDFVDRGWLIIIAFVSGTYPSAIRRRLRACARSIAGRTSSRVDSSSALPWHARSSFSRRSFSWTSASRTSTRSSASSSASRCASSNAGSA